LIDTVRCVNRSSPSRAFLVYGALGNRVTGPWRHTLSTFQDYALLSYVNPLLYMPPAIGHRIKRDGPHDLTLSQFLLGSVILMPANSLRSHLCDALLFGLLDEYRVYE
jgi:hypothetical protein